MALGGYNDGQNLCLQSQQHNFNCPFQLASHKLHPEADSPEDADVYEVELLPGDIVVIGSDGLFDNMWDDQLESIVNEHLRVGHFLKILHSHACQSLPDTSSIHPWEDTRLA